MKPIKLIELFGGVGCQYQALKNIGAECESHVYCEFDKYPVASYNAIHGTNYGTLDVRDLHGRDLNITEKDKYQYWLTYSFPCQDLSVSGKMRGMSKDSNTRSGLLWQVERVLQECVDEGLELPNVLVMENVTQVHSKRNMNDFQQWLDFLVSIGYQNYFEDLEASRYGIAQHRNRCFCVSFLGGNDKFRFPKPVPLETTMADYLDDEVDRKYYIETERADNLIKKLIEDGKLTPEVCRTVRTGGGVV